MTRISKEHTVRKNEILDIAESLFLTKGYENCTINDILTAVGIAKGTFYYYFKSKEEVLDTIVYRIKEIIQQRANEARQTDMPIVQKLMHTFLSMNLTNQMETQQLDDIHKEANALYHQKMLFAITQTMAPILVEIIEEGHQQGIWKSRYPLAYMQIFLASALTLLDDGIFEMKEDEKEQIMLALITLLEHMLEVPENTFLSIMTSQ